MDNETVTFNDYDGTSLGHVDLFGLDEYGNPVGISEYWGVGIGVGLSTGGAILTRALWKSATGYKWAEGIGFLSALLAGGTMMFFKKTRRAGLATLLSSLGAAARQVEMLVSGEAKAMELVQAAAASAGTSGWGVATIEPQQVVGVQGANGVVASHYGLGIPTIEPSAVVRGSVGAPQMPQLVGMGAPGGQMPQLVGAGPQVSGLAKHFGNTIFGGG